MTLAPGTALLGGAVRVSIIEDHALVRSGIRMVMELEPRIEVISEYATASGALAAGDDDPPDVIILDLSLRTENGINFMPQLLRRFPAARILVVTANEEVETHLCAMATGASGVVMKEQAPDILVRAILAVSCGESWIGRAVTAAAISKLARPHHEKREPDAEAVKIASLTPREREVIEVVARGFNGGRIARELRISEATVRHHVTSILSKLDLSNKLELAVFAFHHGLGGRDSSAGDAESAMARGLRQ